MILLLRLSSMLSPSSSSEILPTGLAGGLRCWRSTCTTTRTTSRRHQYYDLLLTLLFLTSLLTPTVVPSDSSASNNSIAPKNSSVNDSSSSSLQRSIQNDSSEGDESSSMMVVMNENSSSGLAVVIPPTTDNSSSSSSASVLVLIVAILLGVPGMIGMGAMFVKLYLRWKADMEELKRREEAEEEEKMRIFDSHIDHVQTDHHGMDDDLTTTTCNNNGRLEGGGGGEDDTVTIDGLRPRKEEREVESTLAKQRSVAFNFSHHDHQAAGENEREQLATENCTGGGGGGEPDDEKGERSIRSIQVSVGSHPIPVRPANSTPRNEPGSDGTATPFDDEGVVVQPPDNDDDVEEEEETREVLATFRRLSVAPTTLTAGDSFGGDAAATSAAGDGTEELDATLQDEEIAGPFAASHNMKASNFDFDEFAHTQLEEQLPDGGAVGEK